MTADLAAALLEYLRGELGEPALRFAEAPTPVSGGFDTRIFAFRLAGAPPACSGPLILRLLAPHHDPVRAVRERVIQNALADLDYPAPRARWVSADASLLGGAFIVMERLRGRPLLEERFFNLSTVLVDVQARLHDLDAEVLLRALEREGPPLSREVITFDAYLGQMEARIADGGLEGLQRAMSWLRERRPPEPGRRAICHGDFHPQNILSEGGVVTGVLDWPNALVADPAYDVASTRIILALTPIALSGVPAALRWVASFVRLMLVKRYLAGMRRRRPLDPAVLDYYEAASAMRGLVRTAEHRRRRASSATSPLDASAFGDMLARHFARVTGILPMLPPRAG